MGEFSKLDYLENLRGADLTSAEFRVLVVMVGYANSSDGKDARPGINRLAKDCGMTERNVKRHLKSLTDKRWLRQQVRGGRSGAGNSWASSYQLIEPASTGQRCHVEKTSQGDKSGMSTGHFASLKVTNCVPQGDTSVTPPGYDPVLDPVNDPVGAEPDPWDGYGGDEQ